jgi:magnesium chelatase subunit D
MWCWGDNELRRIAALCAGLRCGRYARDLVLARTAVEHAAWRGAAAVAVVDIGWGAETGCSRTAPPRPVR